MRKNERPYHQKLVLKNFTAFSNAELEFVPGVNVIIGENGTGKTHILKALYSVQSGSRNGFGVREKFATVFQTYLNSLIRTAADSTASATVEGQFGGVNWRHVFHKDTGVEGPRHETNVVDRDLFPKELVFMPAIDMMGHTRGFVSTYDNFKIDFDLTHREVVSLLLSPERRELPGELQEMVRNLEAVVGGSVELDGERFFLKSANGTLPMPLVAEGLRKVATLIRLIQGGWLCPGSTLFWDEPEVNLNPVLMDEVIGAILMLARSGVQVFLATHSYVILKELEVQSTKDDHVRFFALGRSDAGTQVYCSKTYVDLQPNKIEEQYGDLYDRRIDKLSGVSRAS